MVDGNDVVGLAEEVWDGWDFVDIESASDILEQKILDGLNLDEFGANGFNSTGILNTASTTLINSILIRLSSTQAPTVVDRGSRTAR